MMWDAITPDNGSVRVKSGFLFFPKAIGTRTRWLEFARWHEIYVFSRHPDIEPPRWVALRWLPDIGEEFWQSGPKPG